jgi:quercetin dioxygenase-like cupin family protein
MRKFTDIRIVTAAVIAALAITGSALAVDAKLLVDDAALSDEVDVSSDRIRLKTKDATEVTVQEAVFHPGDVVPFHTHPGVVLIAVKQGALTRIDGDCEVEVNRAGTAFVEAGLEPIRVENRGSENAVIYVTYLQPVGSPRIVQLAPDQAPRC